MVFQEVSTLVKIKMSVSVKVFGPTFSLFACLNVRKQKNILSVYNVH